LYRATLVAKLVATFVALQALTYPSCAQRNDVNSLVSDSDFGTQVAGSQSSAPGAESDSVGANCPASDPENSEGGALQWLTPLEDDLATNASSVAVDSSHDAYMTKQTDGISKLGADGALAWTKPFGSLVAVDASDHVFVAGTFTDSLDLDGTTLVAAGDSDVFVAVLDTAGNVQRSTVLGGAGAESATSLAVSADGRAVVSGPGLGTVALDETGEIAWQKAYTGAVATDSAGSVLVTGGFSGAVDFGGGELTSAGGNDIFVVKLGSDGSHAWSRSFGDTGGTQQGQAIAADGAGNVLVTGVFNGTVDFGTGTHTTHSCPSEVWCNTWGFIAKLDANGTALWSRDRGPMRALTGVTTAASGAVLVSGAEPGNVNPFRRPLLLALDADGTSLWQRLEWPESGLGSGRGVAVDECGSVLWSVSARPSVQANDRAYLAKLFL
jgi:hypothetical protein